MGVEIVFTRSDVEKGHPEHYQEMAAIVKKLWFFFYGRSVTPLTLS